jgi:TM2 domain-containing membrane protein YozV
MPESFCASCGAKMDLSLSDTCPNCGEKYQPTVAKPASEAVQAPSGGKNPVLAAILSFFIPGVGQIYNGNVGRGILTFIAFIIGVFLFVFPGVIVWLWSVYDAYTSAQTL